MVDFSEFLKWYELLDKESINRRKINYFNKDLKDKKEIASPKDNDHA